MLSAKSESLTTELNRVRLMLEKVADDKHLAGIDGNSNSQKKQVDLQEE